jgi:hypothetical protein
MSLWTYPDASEYWILMSITKLRMLPHPYMGVILYPKKMYNTARYIRNRKKPIEEFIMNLDQNSGEQKLRLAALIHAAFMGSLLVYLGLVVFGLDRMQIRPEMDPASGSFNSLRYVFYGISIILVLLLRRLPAWSVAGSQASDSQRIARLFQVSVLTSALCEIPAILGLVLALLTGRRQDFYFLVGLALILFLLHFPRRTRWEEAGE